MKENRNMCNRLGKLGLKAALLLAAMLFSLQADSLRAQDAATAEETKTKDKPPAEAPITPPAEVPATPPAEAPITPPPPAPPAPPSPALPWWLMNAASIKPIEKKWQFHIEGTLSYLHMSGNTKGYTLSGNSMAVLRKKRFTDYTNYSLSKQDMIYGGGNGSTYFTQYTLGTALTYDLVPWFAPIVGVADAKDENLLIDHLLVVYAGPSFSYSPRKSVRVTALAGIAHISVRYQYSSTTTFFALDVDGHGTYLQGTASWTPSLKTRVQVNADITRYDENTIAGKDNAHRLDLTSTLSFSLAKYASLTFAFSMTNQDNVMVKLVNSKRTDLSQNLGITFTF